MKTKKKLQAEVDKFNSRYKVGDKCDIMYNGKLKTVTVKHEATILHDHSAVGWFEELSGCFSLSVVI